MPQLMDFVKPGTIERVLDNHDRMLSNPERVLQGARAFLSRTHKIDGAGGLNTGQAIRTLGEASARVRRAKEVANRGASHASW